MASMAFSTGARFMVDQSFISNQASVKTVAKSLLSIDKSPRNVPNLVLKKGMCSSLSVFHPKGARLLHWHLSAIGSGLEASITDEKKNDISLGDVKIVVESHDVDKIHVRVDLTCEQTQKAFDDVLTNLARTAPPMPGFRRTKGGKTSNVPKSFLLQMLGRDRVTKFVIQEIVSTTIGGYVEKEKLLVKSKIDTSQTAEELESAFSPGAEFGFNATIEIEKAEPEKTQSEKSNPD